MIVTIACPISMTHPEINPESAPIWLDQVGNKYRVTSGIIEECGSTEHTLATANKITILTDLPGLEALATMGLSQPTTTL